MEKGHEEGKSPSSLASFLLFFLHLFFVSCVPPLILPPLVPSFFTFSPLYSLSLLPLLPLFIPSLFLLAIPSCSPAHTRSVLSFLPSFLILSSISLAHIYSCLHPSLLYSLFISYHDCLHLFLISPSSPSFCLFLPSLRLVFYLLSSLFPSVLPPSCLLFSLVRSL